MRNGTKGMVSREKVAAAKDPRAEKAATHRKRPSALRIVKRNTGNDVTPITGIAGAVTEGGGRDSRAARPPRNVTTRRAQVKS